MSNFSYTDYAFNANVSQPANAALGIFSAASYSTSYGNGGDDTAAIQAALNAAASVKGVAFLPPPTSGSLNISAPLVMGTGVFLVGAAPTVSITVIPGSNLNWVISPLTAVASDPYNVCAINYRALVLGGNTYDTFNPAAATSLAQDGGIVNLRLVADTNNTTGRGWGIMLNSTRSFIVDSCVLSGFTESVSVWDSYKFMARNVHSNNGTAAVCIHRASYDSAIVENHAYTASSIPYRVYAEQFAFPGPGNVTLSPMFTKLVDNHVYGTSTYGYDLQGAAYVNLTSTTADVTAGVYQAISRYGVPCYQVLIDTAGTTGVASVSVVTPLENLGTSTAPNIAITPSGTNGYVLTTTGGIVGWAAAAAGGVTGVTASTPLASSGGTTPNVSLTGLVPVANGGTGTATPSLVAGTGIAITGSFPNQTVTNTGGGGTYDATVLAQSPNHYWKMNEAAGATTAADYGTSTSAPLTNGATVAFGGPPLAADGATSVIGNGTSGNYLQMPAAAQPTGNFTITFLHAGGGNSPSGGSGRFWTFDGAGPVTNVFSCGAYSSSIPYCYNWTLESTANYTSSVGVSANRTHVAYVYNGSSVILYLNGVPLYYTNTSSVVASTTYGQICALSARMAKCGMWFSALTQAQIGAQVAAAGL